MRQHRQAPSHGYISIRVDGELYLAHRLAWFYVHGVWPSVWLDHEDRDKTNNRLKNLREATVSQNLQNMSEAWGHSKSGILGVSWTEKSGGQWNAVVHLNGRKVYSSFHDQMEDAQRAYWRAKERFHPFSPPAPVGRESQAAEVV